MKKGWEYKKLGEVCDFISGFAFKSNKFTKSGEPIIRISDIHDGIVDDSNVVYFNKETYNVDLSKYIVEPNDILIAMSGGTTGKIGINTNNRKYYLNQRVGLFREKSIINHYFLFYFLQTKREESLKVAAGAAQPNLSTAQIKSFEIPVPPLSEQQRIVSYLDSAFAKIDAVAKNAENSLNEAKALFQSALTKMMEPKEGWEEKKLGEVANINHGKNQKGVIDIHGKYPIYGSGGNIMGYANSYLCDAGTTILGRKGTINNPVFIETKFWNVDTAFGITAKEGTDKKFIFYFVKSQDWSKKDTGTTLPSLTQKIVKETIIPVPSLSEQKRIASYLDSLKSKVDQLQSNLSRTLAECAALKQAILRQTFE